MKVKFFYFLLSLLFLVPALQAQDVEDYLYKIDLKLRKDKKYLNLNYVDLFGTDQILKQVGALPRTDDKGNLEFKAKEGVTYRVVFLKEGIGIDSLILLYITEISDAAAQSQGPFGESTTAASEQIVVSYKDMYNIKNYSPDKYNKLFTYIDRLQKVDPEYKYPTLLGINPDADVKTGLGMTSRDNTDFLNFMRANSRHWYPKEVKKEKDNRRGAQSEAALPSTRIDAGFTSVTFSHKFMDFAIGGAGLELGVEEKLLNIIPWQTQSITAGFRTLINVSDDKADFKNALSLDARVLARVRMDLTDMATSLPFMSNSAPRLNIGSAVGLDLNMTRAFNFPFLNLYAAVGSAGYSNPYVRTFDDAVKQDVSYFTFTQAMGVFSFYWNTSDKMTSRMRIDVGWGYYDIYKAYYTPGQNNPNSKEKVQDNFYPILALNFNFSPNNSDLLGATLRLFDSQVSVNAWLKLLELQGGHQFRFEATAITNPIARSLREWEPKDLGAIFQIRYRYGF